MGSRLRVLSVRQLLGFSPAHLFLQLRRLRCCYQSCHGLCPPRFVCWSPNPDVMALRPLEGTGDLDQVREWDFNWQPHERRKTGLRKGLVNSLCSVKQQPVGREEPSPGAPSASPRPCAPCLQNCEQWMSVMGSVGSVMAAWAATVPFRSSSTHWPRASSVLGASPWGCRSEKRADGQQGEVTVAVTHALQGTVGGWGSNAW